MNDCFGGMAVTWTAGTSLNAELWSRPGSLGSMSQKGCFPDNTASVGFFGRLKNEMLYRRSLEGVSVSQFIGSVDSYMRWYNEDKVKLSLGAMSPAAYRRSLNRSI